MSTRETLGTVVAFAARFCFACVLFLSPLAYRTTLLERRIGTIYSSYTDFFIYPHDYFLGACLGLGALTLILQKRGLQRGPWYLTFPLLLIVALSWLGVITGIDPALVAYHALRVTLFFGLYLFLVNLNPAPLWIALPLALGVLREGTIALAQFQTQASLGLQAWGELVLDPQETGTSIVRDGALRILRVYGLSDHPNLLGGFFTFALILILGYYFAAAHTRARYLFLVPLALGSAALVLTFSRAASLATLVGFVFLGACVLWQKTQRATRWKNAVLVGSVMLVATAIPTVANLNLLAQRSGTSETASENSGEIRSLTEREVLIESATRIFYKRAVFGVGNGALPLAMFLLDPEFDTTYYYQPAHIVLLTVATELGLFGAAAWLIAMVAPWIVLYARRNELQTNAWLAAVAATLLALTLIGFFDYYTWLLPHGRIWQWTTLGLMGALLNNAASPFKRTN